METAKQQRARDQAHWFYRQLRELEDRSDSDSLYLDLAKEWRELADLRHASLLASNERVRQFYERVTFSTLNRRMGHFYWGFWQGVRIWLFVNELNFVELEIKAWKAFGDQLVEELREHSGKTATLGVQLAERLIHEREQEESIIPRQNAVCRRIHEEFLKLSAAGADHELSPVHATWTKLENWSAFAAGCAPTRDERTGLG